MPFKRSRYPADWEEISASIRDRAGNRCEWPGCDLENDAMVQGKRGPYRIVLTVAHLNHVESDCRPENLRAWCQPHHLRYDAKHHAQSAAATRRSHKIASGQLELFTTSEENQMTDNEGLGIVEISDEDDGEMVEGEEEDEWFSRLQQFFWEREATEDEDGYPIIKVMFSETRLAAGAYALVALDDNGVLIRSVRPDEGLFSKPTFVPWHNIMAMQ